MGFKTIPLKRGFNEIEPLFKLCQQFGAVICGGYARYCASPLLTAKVIQAGDCDLFPKSEDASTKLLEALTAMGFEKQHENHVSITMKPTKEKADELESIPTPQVIKPVIEGKIVTLGTTEEILENFDFTIVRAALVSPTEVMVDEQFEEDEKHKVLRRVISCVQSKRCVFLPIGPTGEQNTRKGLLSYFRSQALEKRAKKIQMESRRKKSTSWNHC